MSLQGLHRDLQDDGGIFVFHLILADELEGHFAFVGERVDSLVQVIDGFFGDQLFLRCRVGMGEKIDHVLIHIDLLHMPRTILADRFVAGNAIDIGIEITDFRQGLPVVPKRQEGIGNDFFRFYG